MTENRYIQDENMCFLHIISDTYGSMSFIIDLEDVERVMEHKWSIMKCNGNSKYKTYNKYYANTSINGEIALLHRFLTNAPKGSVVNHINGNTFDNRRKNLAVGTYSDNNKNVIHRRNKSGICGVCYNKKLGNWIAYITVNSKQRRKYCKTKEEAIEVRKQMMLDEWGTDELTVRI